MMLALAVAALAAANPQAVPTPVPPPAAVVVTLAEALSRARARSPFVAAARERERAADRSSTLVPRAPNPLVELRGENFGPVSTARLPRDMFATVSQAIELGGKRSARTAAAEALGSVAQSDVSAAEWTLASEVADVYVAALRARGVRATLVEQQGGVAEIVDFLARRVREGVTAESDLRKFEAEHTRLGSQIARASIALQSALVRLSAAVGEDLRAEHLAAPPAAALAGAFPEEADIARRADVRVASARVQHAEALLSVERARGVPDVTITVGYKRTSGFDTGVAGITVPIGLFDRNRLATALAGGEAAAARLDLQLVRERALAEVRARWTAVRQLADQAARIDQALVAPAGVVRTAARAAFVEGRGDVLQLVDAERVFGDAAREALELRLDAALAAVHYGLALGEDPRP